MPLTKFHIIPEHLQLQIIEKLQFEEFVQFSSSSRNANQLSLALRKRLPLNLDIISVFATNQGPLSASMKISKNSSRHPFYSGLVLNKQFFEAPVRFISDRLWLIPSSVVCQHITEWAQRTSSSVNTIRMVDEITSSPEEFSHMFQACRATSVDFYAPCWHDVESYPYLKLPCLRNIESIFVQGIRDRPEQKCLPVIHAKNITAEGRFNALDINLFLKQWLDDEREFNTARIIPYNDILDEEIVDLLQDIPHSLLWEDSDDLITMFPEIPVSFKKEDIERPSALRRLFLVEKDGSEQLYVLLLKHCNAQIYYVFANSYSKL